MTRDEYYEDLKRKQEEHLKRVRGLDDTGDNWQPCMHEQCTQCHGTGVKLDGTACVHYISCPCPRCRPTCFNNTSIRNLELSVRSRRTMSRLGIETIGQLCERTEEDLLGCMNFGVTSLNEIKEKLSSFGLHLKRPDGFTNYGHIHSTVVVRP